jgi:hypothetical protein
MRRAWTVADLSAFVSRRCARAAPLALGGKPVSRSAEYCANVAHGAEASHDPEMRRERIERVDLRPELDLVDQVGLAVAGGDFLDHGLEAAEARGVLRVELGDGLQPHDGHGPGDAPLGDLLPEAARVPRVQCTFRNRAS